MNKSVIHSSSSVRTKAYPSGAEVSRCPSAASTITRSSSSTSSQKLLTRENIKSSRITASSYCVLNMQTGFVMSSKRDLELREIASLTKIMTAYTVIDLESKGLISFKDIVKVSKVASKVTGTSAGLMENDEISIKDLLYALMLPSGNDAAWALAEFVGKKLGTGSAPSNFIAEMNLNAKKLNLTYTAFANPHGLMIKRNLSTARDICKLASASMKNKLFQTIVSTKSHTANIINLEVAREVTWENTNKLLNKGFSGVKTGVTSKAGPCLCVCFGNLIVVLLNCRSMDDRWREAEILCKF